MKMHKAIAIMQFKLEGQLMKKHPSFEMEDRRLLHLIDYKAGTIEYEGKTLSCWIHIFPPLTQKTLYTDPRRTTGDGAAAIGIPAL